MSVMFNENGRLPPGVHSLSWQELDDQFGWNFERQRLIAGLRRAALDLKQAGCRTLVVNGSFLTTKDRPADFDACWDRSGTDLRRLLDTPLWTFEHGRAKQKKSYGGELFPADATADGAERHCIDFFQVDKETGEPKGIVRVDLEQSL